MVFPRPFPTDSYDTETSETQAETESTLLKHLPLDPNTPLVLQKNLHMQYLVRNLTQGLPTRYTSQDASQPWLLYWTLQSFSILGVALDPDNKQRTIDTILAWQHPDGGFGGGPGQAAHLLPTYAAVSALANVGRPGPRGGWDQVDRAKMYKFFMSLKQPDGSFLVSHHAEVDARGIYCLLVTAYLLNLLTPQLVEGTAGFVASCQTYEGGFSSSSQPYYSPGPSGTSTILITPRPPLGEAHGGYTFCSLGSWIMLQPFLALEDPSTRPSVDFKALLRWLTHMQGLPIELGGFRGRTNKLVDGCYSWWVGGCFSLLASLGIGGGQGRDVDTGSSDSEGGFWDEVDDSLWNRIALQEYILLAGQHPAGGLRDKPPKSSDAYHTLYCLSGLSSAQHNVFPSPARRSQLRGSWSPVSEFDEVRKEAFIEALSWTEEEGTSQIIGGQGNRVNATHPLFNLTITHTEAMMQHFYGQTLPQRKI